MPNSLLIQALRGLAAVAVVIFHQRTLLDGSMAGSMAFHFHLGVDLFFVISGFVIGISTERESNASVAVFMVRRVFRIVPLAWAVLALLLLIVHADLGSIVRSVFFLPEKPPQFPVNPPQWTLTYEFFFYAIFAFAVGVSHRLRCELSVAVILALTLLDHWLPHANGAFRSFLNSDLLLEFAAGVVLAKCLLLAPPDLPRSAVAGLGAAAIACGVGLFFIRPLDSGLSGFGGVAAMTLAGLLLIERYWPIHVPRLLLQLGELSYAIYIVQHFAFVFVDSKVFWTPMHKTWIYAHTSGASRLVLVLAVVMAISVLLHLLVEKPGIRLGRKVARALQSRMHSRIQLEEV